MPAVAAASKLSLTRHTAVLSLRATPSSLSPGAGQVTVAARVTGSLRCQLRLLSGAGLPVSYSHNAVNCRSGAYMARVVVGPNSSAAPKQLELELIVRGAREATAMSFAIAVKATSTTVTARRPATSTTVPATSTSLPTVVPVVTSPGTTTTTTSVPPGATTATSATTSTATTSTTTTSTTSTTSVTTTTAGAGPQTTPPPALTPMQWTSSNWSGYALSGGPFTAVTGTFTVPSLSAGATSAENTSAWVGIDGWDNQQLIQAGIDEEIDPVTSRVDIWPWWEILPSASTPITTVSVSAGDQVTVSIWQVNGGQWEISLVDSTDGQSFSTLQSYSGAGQSAEWIVEAPENGQTRLIYPLAPYSPAVPFTNLGVAGADQSLDEITLAQGSPAANVSAPSAFSPSGFSVSYTGPEYGARVLGGRKLPGTHGQGTTTPVFEG